MVVVPSPGSSSGAWHRRLPHASGMPQPRGARSSVVRRVPHRGMPGMRSEPIVVTFDMDCYEIIVHSLERSLFLNIGLTSHGGPFVSKHPHRPCAGRVSLHVWDGFCRLGYTCSTDCEPPGL